MGGCQVAALPGIYYEKVYSKKSNYLLMAIFVSFISMMLLYAIEMNGVC